MQKHTGEKFKKAHANTYWLEPIFCEVCINCIVPGEKFVTFYPSNAPVIKSSDFYLAGRFP